MKNIVICNTYKNTKFIIKIDAKIKTDINILKSFYGLLEVTYKSKEVMNECLNKNILKLINN